MQANSSMNSCFSISAAKAGMEDGTFELIGGSGITDPEGRVVAEAEGREGIWGRWRLISRILGKGKGAVLDSDRHRRTEMYGVVTEQTGVVEPPLL